MRVETIPVCFPDRNGKTGSISEVFFLLVH